MSNQSPETEKQLAMRIASAATSDEKDALRLWIERLLALKTSSLSAAQKAKQAVVLTARSDVVLPTLKIIAREVKRHGWDERSLKGRLGIGGSAVGLALFGGQGAGIAALGTAIGVPLWVVFGAGATFLGVLYEEITGAKVQGSTTYRVIDAERVDTK